MENQTEHYTRLNTLAKEVLTLSRNTLLVNLRFLDAALSRLELHALKEGSLETDGQYLCYVPKHVLHSYKLEREAPVRDYLHVVLHCIYRHMFVHTLVDHQAWDLACDIAVEYTITELGLKATAARRESKQAAVFQELKQEVKQLTAEKIYRYYLDKQVSSTEMANLRGLFYADNHRLWYMTEEKKLALGIGGGDETENKTGNGLTMAGMSAAEAEALWSDISQRMQMDMETFSKQQGDKAGGLMQNLRAVNR